MTSDRRTLVAGNWKMHLRREEAQSYCRKLAASEPAEDGPEVALFPAFPLIPVLAAELEDTPIQWGGQDLHPEPSGAHTGDVSAAHLVDWGCRWVLCGHSERRRDHGEGDELVAAKVRAAQEHGLAPVLCVGETEEERAAGQTNAVLARQLESALPDLTRPAALAYEPVWAIGSGQTATPEIAQEAHAFLRQAVSEAADPTAGQELRILYGGSVNSSNCEILLAQPDIDGFLIGGASLDSAEFLDIIRRCGSSG